MSKTKLGATITRCTTDLIEYRASVAYLGVNPNGRKAQRLVVRVNIGLKALGNSERQILIFRYMDGLTWEEIASAMYYSEKWCRVLSKRGLRKLALAMYGVSTRR